MKLLLLAGLLCGVLTSADKPSSVISVSSYNNPVGSSYTVPLSGSSYSAPVPPNAVSYSVTADDLDRQGSNVAPVYGKRADFYGDSVAVAPPSFSRTLSSSYSTGSSSSYPSSDSSTSYSSGSVDTPARKAGTVTSTRLASSPSASSSVASSSSSAQPVGASAPVVSSGTASAASPSTSAAASAAPAASTAAAAASVPESRSDSYVGPAATYEVAAQTYESQPVSTGNLYYYYYPVQEAPIIAEKQDKVSNDLSDPVVLIVLPILVIIGFLAILSILNVTLSGRSFAGRQAPGPMENTFGTFEDLRSNVDSLLQRYYAALESEDCMNRIVCELGTKATNMSGKQWILKALDWIIPTSMQSRIETFREAVSEGYDVTQCRKYFCDSEKIIEARRRK